MAAIEIPRPGSGHLSARRGFYVPEGASFGPRAPLIAPWRPDDVPDSSWADAIVFRGDRCGVVRVASPVFFVSDSCCIVCFLVNGGTFSCLLLWDSENELPVSGCVTADEVVPTVATCAVPAGFFLGLGLGVGKGSMSAVLSAGGCGVIRGVVALAWM